MDGDVNATIQVKTEVFTQTRKVNKRSFQTTIKVCNSILPDGERQTVKTFRFTTEKSSEGKLLAGWIAEGIGVMLAKKGEENG